MNTVAIIVALLVGVTTSFGIEGRQLMDYRLVSDRTILYKRSLEARDDPPPAELPLTDIPPIEARDPPPTELPPTEPPTTDPPLPTCTMAGKMCDADCKRVWVCINSQGHLEPQLLETCQDDKTCNNGVCSTVPTPECSTGKYSFVCKAEGVFPDPSTCKMYHYCIQTDEPGIYVDHVRSCPDYWGYNPGTTYCSKKLVNNYCGAEYPVPVCTKVAQNSALKDNKSIYYVCSLYGNTENVLYPFLYLCPYGQQYDGDFNCKEISNRTTLQNGYL